MSWFMTYIVRSESELIDLVFKKIRKRLRGGFIVALEGPLGAGKTALVRGIAKKLGVKDGVTSPTFNICKIYPVRKKASNGVGFDKIQHIDLYRFENPSIHDIAEVKDWLGDTKAVSFIEWADNVKEAQATAQVKIAIKILSENQRELDFIWK